MTRWLAFAVLMAAGFLPPVDFFIVNVALPSIHASLNATPAEVQLVISGYAAGYAVFLIVGGRLGDMFGRRRCFIIGMAAFTLTNLMCGLARTPTELVIGRVLQGLAAALLAPQVLASIRALYPDERGLSRALSVYGMTMGLAAAIGQFSGGALVQWNPLDLGWRAIFLIKLPICLLTMLAAWNLLPEAGGGSANARPPRKTRTLRRRRNFMRMEFSSPKTKGKRCATLTACDFGLRRGLKRQPLSKLPSCLPFDSPDFSSSPRLRQRLAR